MDGGAWLVHRVARLRRDLVTPTALHLQPLSWRFYPLLGHSPAKMTLGISVVPSASSFHLTQQHTLFWELNSQALPQPTSLHEIGCLPTSAALLQACLSSGGVWWPPQGSCSCCFLFQKWHFCLFLAHFNICPLFSQHSTREGSSDIDDYPPHAFIRPRAFSLQHSLELQFYVNLWKYLINNLHRVKVLRR